MKLLTILAVLMATCETAHAAAVEYISPGYRNSIGKVEPSVVLPVAPTASSTWFVKNTAAGGGLTVSPAPTATWLAVSVGDVNGAGVLVRNSSTPTGRGNSQMVSVEATQVPISQGDVTGLSVAGNMTVTPYRDSANTVLGNALKTAVVGSASPFAGAVVVTAGKGGTQYLPSGTFGFTVFASADATTTTFCHVSYNSMAAAAADSGEDCGVGYITLSKSDIPIINVIKHTNLSLPATGVTLYLFDKGGTATYHYAGEMVYK